MQAVGLASSEVILGAFQPKHASFQLICVFPTRAASPHTVCGVCGCQTQGFQGEPTTTMSWKFPPRACAEVASAILPVQCLTVKGRKRENGALTFVASLPRLGPQGDPRVSLRGERHENQFRASALFPLAATGQETSSSFVLKGSPLADIHRGI